VAPRVDVVAQARLVGELEEQRQRVVGDAVLRVVEVEPGRLHVHAVAPARLRREQVAQVRTRDLGVVRLERGPRGTLPQREDVGHGTPSRSCVPSASM